jgi:Icc-related predicted phosphoesterase
MVNIININRGNILVATDLHGNWDDYFKIKRKFLDFKQKGKADFLVLAGDLIHKYNGFEDNSVKILDDLIDKPDPSIIPILGNHEFMHIYHLCVTRQGEEGIVEPFETAIESNREKYIGFFMNMAYAVITKGGIIINHTGANPPMAGFCRPEYNDLMQKEMQGTHPTDYIRGLDHNTLLDILKAQTREHIEQTDSNLKKNKGKLDPQFFDDFTPQVGEFFMSQPIGQYLWDVFFNRNEFEYGNTNYKQMLTNFLENFNTDNIPLDYLVCGHIPVQNGCETFGGRQLRLSSSYGAHLHNKLMAYIDASVKYSSINDVVNRLEPI